MSRSGCGALSEEKDPHPAKRNGQLSIPLRDAVSELLAEEGAIESFQPRSVKLTAGAALLAATTTALWGTNPTALKIALIDLPPMGAAGLRFAIAVVGVLIWCRITRVTVRPQPGELLWLVVNGLFFLVQIATFTFGVHWGTASHSIVILHCYPLFVVALAHFWLPDERVSLGKALGLTAALGGIVALFAGEWGKWQGAQMWGDLIQLFSAVILAAQIVFLKHAVSRIEPTRVVLWQMLLGAAAFLLYGLLFEGLWGRSVGWESWAAVLYQGVVIGAFCFTIWFAQIKRYSASAISIFGFVAPVVGVVVSTYLLHEPFTPVLALSSALVAAGIVVASVW
jgi:drug/metabolite transporter (DMT)-like permease